MFLCIRDTKTLRLKTVDGNRKQTLFLSQDLWIIISEMHCGHMLELLWLQVCIRHTSAQILPNKQIKLLRKTWKQQLRTVHNSWVFLSSFYTTHVWAKENFSFPFSSKEHAYGFCIKAKQRALFSIGINKHTK